MRDASLACAIFLILPAVSGAATLHVPAEYSLIQDAIDAAAAGDVVLVAAGIYSGEGNINLDFNGKDISLESESGPVSTVIQCDGNGRGLYFHNGESPSARVLGFTIRYGFDLHGGGILIEVASPTIENCIIEYNFGNSRGGGISAFGPCRISDCIIRFNGTGSDTDPGRGGGMNVIGSAVIERTVIVSNWARGRQFSDGLGGGVVASGAEFVDCVIAGNEAGAGGGISGERLTLDDCLITGNVAVRGGGVYASHVTLRGCTVAGNLAWFRGGGLATYVEGLVDVERTIVWGNCSSSDGEDIYQDVYLEQSSIMNAACSDFDPSRIGGPGTLNETGENLHSDPLFCEPRPCDDDPTSEGDYSIASASLCLPGTSPCGQLIGARDEGCKSVPVASVSWGEVKARYSPR